MTEVKDVKEPERSALLAQFDRDAAFFASRQPQLLRDHPDEWVAIYQERVVGTAPDLDQLVAVLRASGVPAERAYVQRLSTAETLLIV